ncbi:hypothetical protein C8R43DRAFT_1234000 [Mycena crocata]|nr:hypothetical protein C8R43DRAFT_1234000 [Mycena crocata]
MSSLPTFSFSTTADEVVSALTEQIKGKNVLITGTSINGIGFEAARAIAKHANLVVITGYNDERLKLSEQAIKKDTPGANIRRLLLDLASFAGVRKAAAEVKAYPEPLHVLVNNAGAAAGAFKLTEDGLESQMATDHVGHFLLTKLLTPKLLASATKDYTPRVVFVSSVAHMGGTGVNFDTLQHPSAETYKATEAYFQAKSANILTAIELSRRSNGVLHGYSLHPGQIFTTLMQKEGAVEDLKAFGILGPDGLPNLNNPDSPWKTIEQGAATTIAAAFDPRIAAQPGAYLVDSVIANEKIAPHSCDLANAEKLWTLTEDIVGERFAF